MLRVQGEESSEPDLDLELVGGGVADGEGERGGVPGGLAHVQVGWGGEVRGGRLQDTGGMRDCEVTVEASVGAAEVGVAAVGAWRGVLGG